AGADKGLRPDAGPPLRHLIGLVRHRRGLLPLFLFGRARLRPHRAGRHLRAGLPADRRGAALRRAAAAEEDPPHRHDRAVRANEAMDETLDKLGGFIAGALAGVGPRRPDAPGGRARPPRRATPAKSARIPTQPRALTS